MGQWLSERLGQPSVIENRSGAANNVAAETVANAKPDGYTLLLVNPANALKPTLYDKLNYNFIRDIAPVAGLLRAPNVMEVRPSVPARTVPEFIAYAKSNPSKVTYASAGTGTLLHVAGEQFRMMAGIDIIHVPSRHGPALTDLLGRQVEIGATTISTSIEHIRAGKLHPTSGDYGEALRNAAGPPDRGAISCRVLTQSAFFGIGAPGARPGGSIDRLTGDMDSPHRCAGVEGQLWPRGSASITQLAPIRLSQAYCRGNQQMGQGDQARRHQAEVIRPWPTPSSPPSAAARPTRQQAESADDPPGRGSSHRGRCAHGQNRETSPSCLEKSGRAEPPAGASVPLRLLRQACGPERLDLQPGVIGENVTTRGVDLLALRRGTRLRLGGEAVIEVTGLRNPCRQIDDLTAG